MYIFFLKEKEKNLDVMNMYTQRFSKASQQLTIVTTPMTTNQLIQTQVTCPASKSMSVHIDPGSSDSTSPDSVFQAKSTQTEVCLDPTSTNKTLKVVSSWQKIVDSKLMAHKAVQTGDRAVNNASIQTIEQSAVKPLPSNAVTYGLPTSDLSTSHINQTHTGRQIPTAVDSGGFCGVTNGSGGPEKGKDHCSDVVGQGSALGGTVKGTSEFGGGRGGSHGVEKSEGEAEAEEGRGVYGEDKRFGIFDEEKRKKEELLAKLRAIDGVKNPPESQPIQSTAVRGSLDLTQENHPFHSGVDHRRGSIEALTNQPSISGKEGSTQGSDSQPDTGQTRNSDNDHIRRVEYGSQPLHPGGLAQGKNDEAIGSSPTSGSQSHSHNQHNPLAPSSQLLNSHIGGSAQNQPISSNILSGNEFQNSGGIAEGNNFGGISSAGQSTTDTKSTRPPSDKLEYGISVSQVASNHTASLFGTSTINSENPKSKESSLFAGGQLTKGITDLSSLQNGQSRTTVSTHFQGTITSTAARTQQQPRHTDTAGKFKPVTQGSNRENSQKTVSSKNSSSISSVQSWPDPIQNMHTGKPAYATKNDPFGSKHAAYISTIKRSSVESSEYKPMHGRRAGNTLFNKESLSSELGRISENHPGRKSPSNLDFKPRQESESYPWEVAIDVHKKEPGVTTKTRELSGKQKRIVRGELASVSSKEGLLLPFRPKKTSIEMLMGESMPGSVGVSEPDDLEEVVL